MTTRPQSIEEAYDWTLERLEAGTLTPAELSRTLGTDLSQRVLLFLNYLVTLGLAARMGTGRQVAYTSERTADIVRLLQNQARAETTVNFTSVSASTEVAEAFFKELLGAARHELLLALPFLELDGLVYFTDEIIGLGRPPANCCA